MAATRRNILTNDNDRNLFIQACLLLKQEPTGFSTADLGISSGPLAIERDLSLWDLFVLWHLYAMNQISSDGRRNAAHMGPVFLPWHRWYMLVLEFEMRRVLGVGQDDFGIPYWDWSADGDALTPQEQINSAGLWGFIGGNGQGFGQELTEGPFTASAFPLNIEATPTGQPRATNRGLRRNFGADIIADRLPTSAETSAALAQASYDSGSFDTRSDGFRNRLEGWVPESQAPAMHNQVHVWAGGDMLPGSSPNDPLFFLNHCNVDRLWSEWQQDNPTIPYSPQGRSASEQAVLFRHRAQDPLYSILTSSPPVQAMFNLGDFYTYE